MPKYEKGICIFCAKCRDDCVASNWGSICHDCWQKMAHDSRPDQGTQGTMVAIPPGPDLFGYAIMEGERTYITVGRTLLVFAHEEHALERAAEIGKAEPEAKLRVERVRMLEPFLYCVRNGLKCLFVEDVRSPGQAGSKEGH